MISAIISRIIVLLCGTLYPAYASFKAVRTKNVKEYVKWMMYWIVFALFTCTEAIADMLLAFWLPFYYEMKIIFVIWLLSPATKGASILYRKFVHPHLVKREKDIDEYIARTTEKGYSAVLELGSKGFSYATNIVLTTALKGQARIADQIRRSYSLSDISEDRVDGRAIVYRRGTSMRAPLHYDSDDDEENRRLQEEFDRDMAELRARQAASQKRLSVDAELFPLAEEKGDDPSTRPVRPRPAHYSHKEASHIGTLPRSRSLRSTRPTINKTRGDDER